MIKPKHLEPGDRVAVVSLSSGILGEPWAIHKLDIARERLERDFALSVRVMPNALKGVDWLDAHPEARAADLMEAFADPTVKGIITAIGGDDSIRLLPTSTLISFTATRKSSPAFPTLPSTIS